MQTAPLPRLTVKSLDVLCDVATEDEAGTVGTVQGLIEGVLNRYEGVLDDAAVAALLAVAHWHVPLMQDDIDALERAQGAADAH